jgi:ATP-dependent Lhr-like helicase
LFGGSVGRSEAIFSKFSKDLRKVLSKSKLKAPSSIQQRAITPILEGENILLISPTGSGKTLATMLPIFDLWVREKPKPISILYITPLKALNRNLFDRMIWWGRQLGMDISIRHGDTTQYERRKQTQFPDDMLIVTPETLQAILTGKRLREHLKNVKRVIVDEVHSLVESKRGTQLSIGLERLRRLSGDFQLISLSATIGSPDYIANFISGGRKIKIIKVLEEKDMDINVISPRPTREDMEISERLFTAPDVSARLRKTHNLISENTSTLVFSNTRDFAEILTSRLKQIFPKTPVANHHSSLSKSVRLDVEKKFKAQEYKAIVCTSSLELGIDIGSIDFILQYQSPRQVTKLIQRIGRAGHSLGRVSKGTVIASDVDDIFESAVISRRSLSGELEPIKSHENALDVLAAQIIGSLMANGETPEEIYSMVKKAYPYRNLTLEEFNEVVQQLSNTRYLFINDDGLRFSRKGRLYYFDNLSTIPDIKSYTVVNMLTNDKVGSLDEEFVAMNGNPGTVFVIKGDTWKIVSVESGKIYVEPVGVAEAAIPGWEGDLMPVPFGVAQEVGKLRERIRKSSLKKPKNEVIDEIIKNYPVDEKSAQKMYDVIKKQAKNSAVPSDKNVLIESHADKLIIHTCLGSNANETLGRFLSTALAPKIGSVSLNIDPYRIIIGMQIVNPDLVRDILLKTSPEKVEDYLEINLSNSKLFQWKFIHVAKRFGLIGRDVDFQRIRMNKIIDLYSGTPVWKETLREIKTDKMDVGRTMEFLEKIQKGNLEIIFRKGLSPLGSLGIKERSELIGPEDPDLNIMEIFERRLLNKKVRLVCLNCGEWSQLSKVRDLSDQIKCAKCKAKLIAMTREADTDSQRIVRKKLKKSDLTVEETDRLNRLNDTSDLIIVYGRKAVEALAARGIGPRTAKRVLRGMYPTREDFIKALLEAERQFVRTKKFWG